MTNNTQVAPIVRVENTDIPVIVYQNQRVITTELIVQVYGTAITNIQQNFTNNQNRFEQGKHYFKLEGDELTIFKRVSPQINKRTRHLILWTERGAARHAKMLDTDQAWNVFDKLEHDYFEPAQPSEQLPPPTMPHRYRILTTIDRGQEPVQQIIPEKSCIVDPTDPVAIATFIREFVPSNPKTLSAIGSAYITKLMNCQDAAINHLNK